ncbi:MAG: hypothetical protein O2931_04690 [Planctomycetota bacterium]|nr:hypothetical protein [Planctomycetota bacterium]MDA1178078.1 hypothetical protein [Planctomycetota bacterium]
MPAPTASLARVSILIFATFTPTLFVNRPLSADAIDDALQQLTEAGTSAGAASKIQSNWKKLAAASPQNIERILGSIRADRPLAANWIRSAAETIVDRARREGKFPRHDLERFYLNQQNPPRARRMAYELLVQEDPTLSASWLPNALQDTSLEMRRDAVAVVLQAAQNALQTEEQQNESAHTASTKLFEQALLSARDLDQVKLAADELRKLGKTVELVKHFGFLTQWQLAGPFDNRERKGFTEIIAPETDPRVWQMATTIDESISYTGVDGEVHWTPHETTDEMGVVDLNTAISQRKEVTAFARTVFDSPQAAAAQLRMTSLNANKTWVNGQLVMAHEVYHAGSELDQYVVPIQLRKGANVILVKLCQNEQTEEWAVDWKFQLRLCDDLGGPLPKAD